MDRTTPATPAAATEAEPMKQRGRNIELPAVTPAARGRARSRAA
jgi:hypothetical protein